MPADSTATFDLVAWVVIVALFSAYTKNMQQTMLRLGRMLFDNGNPPGTGVQDALTPNWQTRNNIIMIVGLGVFAIVCFYFLVWYFAIALFLLTFFVLIPVVSVLLMPRPLSWHYIRKIQADLQRRQKEYGEIGDAPRAQATTELLGRIDKMLQEKGTNAP